MARPGPARLGITVAALTRQLSRLHALELINKITHNYRYYLMRPGRTNIATACSLIRFSIVPALGACAAAHLTVMNPVQRTRVHGC